MPHRIQLHRRQYHGYHIHAAGADGHECQRDHQTPGGVRRIRLLREIPRSSDYLKLSHFGAAGQVAASYLTSLMASR